MNELKVYLQNLSIIVSLFGVEFVKMNYNAIYYIEVGFSRKEPYYIYIRCIRITNENKI